jgi:tRNA(Ile)-lysidine synthase
LAIKDLKRRVLDFSRAGSLLRAGDRVCVAVSGGADSVALLRLLLELRPEIGIVLSVAHVNHNLRGDDSDADAAFVSALATEHGLELHAASEDVRRFGTEHSLSLEAAGRQLRYRFFSKILRQGHVTRVATAHTADDQAETVLLRLLRGAGSRGLAGILRSRNARVAADVSSADSPRSGEASIVRPLLSTRRSELRDYLRDIGQPWREDASNSDLSFARNRVRAELIPLLERDYNPAVVDALSGTAEIARAEEEFWDAELARLLPNVVTPAGRLRIVELARQPLAVQRRLVRLVAGSLDFERLEQVLEFAFRRDRGERVLPLPGNRTAHIAAGELWLESASTIADPAPGDYLYRLPIPGEVCVRELNRRITASLLTVDAATRGYNPQQFLDPATLASELSVRNWRAGDRFRPLHGKTPRKLKDLLPKVAARERSAWPVVLSGDQIVWVRGLAVAHGRSARRADKVVVIEETAV